MTSNLIGLNPVGTLYACMYVSAQVNELLSVTERGSEKGRSTMHAAVAGE